MFLSVYPSPCLVLDFGTSDVIMLANKALTAATVDCEWKKQIHTHKHTHSDAHTPYHKDGGITYCAGYRYKHEREGRGPLRPCRTGGFMFQQFQLFPNVFVLRIQHCVDCHGSRVQGEGE